MTDRIEQHLAEVVALQKQILANQEKQAARAEAYMDRAAELRQTTMRSFRRTLWTIIAIVAGMILLPVALNYLVRHG